MEGGEADWKGEEHEKNQGLQKNAEEDDGQSQSSANQSPEVILNFSNTINKTARCVSFGADFLFDVCSAEVTSSNRPSRRRLQESWPCVCVLTFEI